LAIKYYITNDISIAAYMLMRGVPLKRVDVEVPGGRYIFEFDDSGDLCKKYSLEFLTSESCMYDSYVRKLRSMIKSL
jgi:hypothetical protein